MDSKEILEREKKIAMKAALIATNPVLGRVLATVPEKIFDGLIAMSEPKKEKQEENGSIGLDESKSGSKNNQKTKQDSSRSAAYNLGQTLFSHRLGGVLVLGHSGSGKTELFESARQVYDLKNENYSCLNKECQSTVTEEKEKWGNGRFFIKNGDNFLPFSLYTTIDAYGNLYGQEEALKKLKNVTSVIIVFDLQDLYNGKMHSITNGEEFCEEVPLVDYLKVWVKVLIAKLKILVGNASDTEGSYNKAKTQKMLEMQDLIKKENLTHEQRESQIQNLQQKARRSLQEKNQVKKIIFLATHADCCQEENSEIIKEHLQWKKLTECVKDFDSSIQCSFLKGSFISSDSTKELWSSLAKQMSKND